jgi:uncharacterized protein (TIGR02217 family)
VSNFVYPNLPGLTFNSVRSPHYNTGIQSAMSDVESRIAYQQYPVIHWELIYELLRDYVTPSDLKALVGLYNAVQGQWDTFLYADPVFNAVTAQQFATVGSSDTDTTLYQLTAVYENSGGPGGPEIIQNFQSSPEIYGNGTLINSAYYSISGTGALNFLSGHVPASGVVLTWTGSFYYRVRFNDDTLDVSQFMQNFWELKKVKLKQVIL